MPSTRISRRRLLTAGGGCLAATLAGCAESWESGSSSETVTDGRPIESTHEYETTFLRADEDAPFLYPDDDAADDADDGPGSRLHATFFVTDEDDAAALRIDADDAITSDARTFVEVTDFDEESVLIDQRSIDDCYRRRLRGIRAADDSIRTDYCRELKAPTTPCVAEKTVMEAVLVRIHRPYEDHPSSRSSRESGSCPDEFPTDDSAADETATDESGNREETNDTTATGEPDETNETDDGGQR